MNARSFTKPPYKDHRYEFTPLWLSLQENTKSRIRSALLLCIYRTCLEAPQNTMGSSTHTVLTVDIGRVSGLCCGLNDLWIVPLQIGVVMILIYNKVCWLTAHSEVTVENRYIYHAMSL